MKCSVSKRKVRLQILLGLPSQTNFDTFQTVFYPCERPFRCLQTKESHEDGRNREFQNVKLDLQL